MLEEKEKTLLCEWICFQLREVTFPLEALLKEDFVSGGGWNWTTPEEVMEAKSREPGGTRAETKRKKL